MGVRWGGMKKVEDYNKKAKQREEMWKKLSKEEDIVEFYKQYVCYLEFDGIYSLC